MLCRMAEREADRAQPERLRRQAVAALVSDAGREISPVFLRRLREHDSAPRLFGAGEIAAAAQSGLETDIARNISSGRGVDSTDALRDAFRRRGEGYALEQKCQLIADRHPAATLAPQSVKAACDEGALIAATLILSGQAAPRINPRVRLNDDLLGHRNGEAAP
jgi:hypothetical protein